MSRSYRNEHLFSEIYLESITQQPETSENLRASFQTIKEWREFADKTSLEKWITTYIEPVLDTLGFGHHKDSEELPNIKKYFMLLKNNEDCEKWYEYHCGRGYRNVDLIERSKKIIYPTKMYTNRGSCFYLDAENVLIGMDCGAIITSENIPLEVITVILNSKLIWYYLRRKFKRYANRQTVSVKEIPIVIPDYIELFVLIYNYLFFINASNERRKSNLAIIKYLKKNIVDPLVYELYFKDIVKTNLSSIINSYCENISYFENEKKKLQIINNTIDKLKNNNEIQREIKAIKDCK